MDQVGVRPVQGLRRLSTCPVNGVGQRPSSKVKVNRDNSLYPPMKFERQRGESLQKKFVKNSFERTREVLLTDAILNGPREGVGDT